MSENPAETQSASPDSPVQAGRQTRQGFGDLVESLRSPDAPTRRTAVYFFVSLAAAIWVSFYGVRYLLAPEPMVAGRASNANNEADLGENFGEFLEKQAQEAKWKNTTLGLGDFIVDLKKNPEEAKLPRARGVMSIAHVEIFVECDSRETCEYIETASVQARSHVTNALIQVERDDLMTKDGKKKIKKAVIDRLNSWLPKGKIENVFISKLIIS